MHANLTPLIDVTFLLIVFFVLVAQITNSQIVEEIDLPEPEKSVSIAPDVNQESRLTLNVLPDSANKRRIVGYRLGTRDYPATSDGLVRLTRELHAAASRNPEITLDLRADRLTPYSQVHPAMKSAQAAGIARINLLVRASTDAREDPGE